MYYLVEKCTILMRFEATYVCTNLRSNLATIKIFWVLCSQHKSLKWFLLPKTETKVKLILSYVRKCSLKFKLNGKCVFLIVLRTVNCKESKKKFETAWSLLILAGY